MKNRSNEPAWDYIARNVRDIGPKMTKYIFDLKKPRKNVFLELDKFSICAGDNNCLVSRTDGVERRISLARFMMNWDI